MRAVVSAAIVLALAACSRPAPAPERDGAPEQAVRVALPASEPLPGPSDADAKPVWAGSADGSAARFGNPGEGPLLSIACRSGVLVVTRHAPAEVGAQALFALIGGGRIVRLPVDATSVPGSRGYLWQGTLPADDEAAGVFTEGAFAGTLPGAGRIEVSAGAPPRDVVSRCRTRPIAATVPQPAEPGATTAE